VCVYIYTYTPVIPCTLGQDLGGCTHNCILARRAGDEETHLLEKKEDSVP